VIDALQYFADCVFYLRWVLVLIGFFVAGVLIYCANETAAAWKQDADDARGEVDDLRRRMYLRDLADPRAAGRVVVLPTRKTEAR
jgi:hypothetical protein